MTVDQAGAFPSFDVLGIPVSITSLATASAAIARWAGDDAGRFVCIRDVHGVMQSQRHPALLALHRSAAMVTPDGMPLVWLGRRRGLPVERTCGPDLMERVIADSGQSGLVHYFHGGKDGVAQRVAHGFRRRFPRLAIVAAETAPFHEPCDSEIALLAARIRDSGAHVVWIGLSTPKQEFLMQRLAPLVPATLIGVGAAFDFHAGAVRRAPGWMQRAGLEWLFRLLSEPRRLWRRYLILAPQFVMLVAARHLAARGRVRAAGAS